MLENNELANMLRAIIQEELQKELNPLKEDVKSIQKDVSTIKKEVRLVWNDILKLDKRLLVQEEKTAF